MGSNWKAVESRGKSGGILEIRMAELGRITGMRVYGLSYVSTLRAYCYFTNAGVRVAGRAPASEAWKRASRRTLL